MKAEELMIGDWLFYKGPFNAFPFKVEQITMNKVGYHAEPNDSRMHYIRLCMCNPIPLTKEILERNGFHSLENGHIWEYEDQESDFLLENFPDGFVWMIGLCNIAKIYNVHELQNALKLCKIEKDIVL